MTVAAVVVVSEEAVNVTLEAVAVFEETVAQGFGALASSHVAPLASSHVVLLASSQVALLALVFLHSTELQNLKHQKNGSPAFPRCADHDSLRRAASV